MARRAKRRTETKFRGIHTARLHPEGRRLLGDNGTPTHTELDSSGFCCPPVRPLGGHGYDGDPNCEITAIRRRMEHRSHVGVVTVAWRFTLSRRRERARQGTSELQG